MFEQAVVFRSEFYEIHKVFDVRTPDSPIAFEIVHRMTGYVACIYGESKDSFIRIVKKRITAKSSGEEDDNFLDGFMSLGTIVSKNILH